jgi:hypothetical protein
VIFRIADLLCHARGTTFSLSEGASKTLALMLFPAAALAGEQLYVETLERTVAVDRIIRRTAERTRPSTLILFTADCSHGLRLPGRRKGQDIPPLES